MTLTLAVNIGRACVQHNDAMPIIFGFHLFYECSAFFSFNSIVSINNATNRNLFHNILHDKSMHTEKWDQVTCHIVNTIVFCLI